MIWRHRSQFSPSCPSIMTPSCIPALLLRLAHDLKRYALSLHRITDGLLHFQSLISQPDRCVSSKLVPPSTGSNLSNICAEAVLYHPKRRNRVETCSSK